MSTDVFIHEQALVGATEIGAGTRIWAFAHILVGARIGVECNICDHTFIESDVVVGDRVTIKSGVQLWDGIRLEDDVFVGPNATFTNDPAPRSKQHLDDYPVTTVRQGASIGANATILPGLTIGQHAMVGAGAVVTRSVPPHAVVVGNPARIVRYAGDAGSPYGVGGSPDPATAPTPEDPEIRVRGVSLYRVPRVEDLRGDLIAREVGKGLPFTPERCFLVLDVPSREVRGEHAHRECEQLMVCLRGSVSCVVDDGERHQEVLLDSPELGIHVPPMVWATQYKYSPDAVLMVFASDPYDPDDYIRDYDDFLALVRGGDGTAGSG